MSRWGSRFRDVSVPYTTDTVDNVDTVAPPAELPPESVNTVKSVSGEAGRGYHSRAGTVSTASSVSLREERTEYGAALLRAVIEALAALSEPDAELERERVEIAAARAAEARGEYGRPIPIGVALTIANAIHGEELWP